MTNIVTPEVPAEALAKPVNMRVRRTKRVRKVKVKLRDTTSIDVRTCAGRNLVAWRNSLLKALGGREHISPQREALIESATTTRALLVHLDRYLLERPHLAGRKSLFTVLDRRQNLADSLLRTLTALGLERIEVPDPGFTPTVVKPYGYVEDRTA